MRLNQVRKFIKRSTVFIISLILLVISFGVAYQFYFDKKFDKKFKPTGNFVTINDRKVHYVKSGEGRASVIFEPGVQFWSTSWRGIQSEVSKFATSYSYDRGGMGFSEILEDIDSETYVNELNLLIEKLEIESPIILVGHSFGGVVINAFYNRFPDKVNGIILIEPGNPKDVLEWAPEIKPVHIKLAELSASIGIVRFFYRNKLQNSNYDKYTVNEFKHIFAKPKVTRSFAQSLQVLRELVIKSEIKSFDDTPIEILYTSNFDEVGTNFENDEEREVWKSEYLSYWNSLPLKSNKGKGVYLISGANHNSVVLDSNYTVTIANRIKEMLQDVQR